MTQSPRTRIGRIPVLAVQPVIEGGKWPTKAVVGEVVPLKAQVFREGHDAVGATAVVIDPEGQIHARLRMRDLATGLDWWQAEFIPTSAGRWSFRIEGWSDPVGTWVHDARIKVSNQIDVALMLEEGALVLERARPDLPSDLRALLRHSIKTLRDTTLAPLERLRAGIDAAAEIAQEHPLRDFVSPSDTYQIEVHRQRALFSAWYEIFPRSYGTWQDAKGRWHTGNLQGATHELDRIAGLGFDVVYLTPIHPIGSTNRKGRNNTLNAKPGDPGSPYGIGAAEGGHDSIHPDLGSFDDFDAFVARAHELNLEVALDIALQASPDHPWVTEHPEWFVTRADGSIAYAENPPKKYQDIYPLSFDRDPQGLFDAIRDVIQLWIDHGVTLFRVDNPHTKPLVFWEELLAHFNQVHPEVIFLSEAFTKPAMMKALAMVGYHQSYTYFTWRNNAAELGQYLYEVSHDTSDVLRPNFWPTTHDILTPYVQQGGVAAHAIRAILAATGSPSWGIYSGYELAESVARPGYEEHIDNEKYEYKARDFSGGEVTGLNELLRRLNEIRNQNPALAQLRNLTLHHSSDDAILVFSKRISAQHSPTGEDNTIIVVASTDPFSTREGLIHLDMEALGLTQDEIFDAQDLLGGDTYEWGHSPFVRLDPRGACAHIIKVRRR